MPTPPNTTSATARVITSLPYTFTEDVADQADTLVLWYTYTAVANDRVIGVTPFADTASVYAPRLRVYTSDATTIYKGISAPTQRSVAVPVTAGNQYYFRVIQGGVGTPLGASLVFSVVRAPQTATPAGSIISTDQASSTSRMKPPIVSALTTEVYQFIDDFAFMVASIGTTLDDGTMCGDDQGDTVAIWTQTPALTEVYNALPSYYAYTPSVISSNGTNLFYLAYDTTPGNPQHLRTLSPLGGEAATAWTLPANSEDSRGGTPNRAGTIYYYGQKAASGSAVHRYDLANSMALSDLAATQGAGWGVHPEIVALTDGTLLVGYAHVTATVNYKIIHYSAAGAVLRTYDLGANPLHHLSNGLTDAAFYVWVHDASASAKRSIYSIIETSSGTQLSSGTYDHFTAGIDAISYDPDYPTNNGPAFGVADTCTFFITHVALVANPTHTLPVFTTVIDPIRRQRTAPHLWDGTSANRIQYPGFQLLFEAGGPRDVSAPLLITLEMSRDGGHTWGNLHTIEAGDIGQYRYRAIWRRLGIARDAVFRVTESNSAKTVWLAALLDPDPVQGAS